MMNFLRNEVAFRFVVFFFGILFAVTGFFAPARALTALKCAMREW